MTEYVKSTRPCYLDNPGFLDFAKRLMPAYFMSARIGHPNMVKTMIDLFSSDYEEASRIINIQNIRDLRTIIYAFFQPHGSRWINFVIDAQEMYHKTQGSKESLSPEAEPTGEHQSLGSTSLEGLTD